MSDVLQDRNFVLGVVAAGAVIIATVSYVILGPEVWKGRAASVRCTGLINLGNTCFVNAVIQALASLPSISEWLQKCHGQYQGVLISSLKDVLQDLVIGDKLEVSPRQVLNGLTRHGWMINHQQQDALEFYNIILSTIEEEMIVSQGSLSELRGLLEINDMCISNNTTNNGSTVLTRLGQSFSPVCVPRCPLKGLLVSTLICCKCRIKLPSKYEYFDCLSLPIKGQFSGQVLLENCFKSYLSTEIVTGVNCTHCSKITSVNERRNFTKKTQIGRLPTCLCIHIGRTVWSTDGSISKNCTHLKFPMSFDASQFTEHSDHKSRVYKLCAVVEHIGGPHSGHYCTYRRHSNHWVYTSDSSVYSVSAQEVLQSQAYMLLYQRT